MRKLTARTVLPRHDDVSSDHLANVTHEASISRSRQGQLRVENVLCAISAKEKQREWAAAPG